MRGSTSGELVMDFIPQGPTFAVGEVVLTSGLGARFPKGIVIGTVESIETQANAVFQKAVVDPSVDFGSLELVLVITNFDPNEALPDFQAPATITETIQLKARRSWRRRQSPARYRLRQHRRRVRQAQPGEQPAGTTP